MAEYEDDRIDAYLRAARDEAEQVIGRLRRRVSELVEENQEVRSFGRRMAKDKFTLTKQNEALTERVLQLEGTQTAEDHARNMDAVIALMDSMFPQRLRDRMPASCG